MLPQEVWVAIGSLGAAFGTLIAAIALIITIRTQAQQQNLTRSIHQQQVLLQQRQVLLPLWEYFEKLTDVNPAAPVWEDVRKTSNTLELIAVCWEGQLIDQDVVRRMMADTFLELYDKIDQCQNPPPGFPMDGRRMLRESPATQKLYALLKQEKIEHGQIKPIGKV